VAKHPEIIGVAVYANSATPIKQSTIPMLQHLAGKATTKPTSSSDVIKLYHYPETESYLFATPFQKTFKYSSEAVTHSRNLAFLKPLMNGPYFDLEAIWDEHTYYEFDTRSVPDTMSTMVQEPYVNHIPTV
jgi:carboxymethylenebutenolidase